ncbi:MAG: endonuclease domain-containing protein [Phycisphaerae bacterium]|nr:endonuclease domain-containing protein [Phycisphaerae bacterium]
MATPSRRTRDRARELRRRLAPAEVLLWNLLRDRSNGVAFRRQHPVGPFIVDFACVKARLAVELDGRSHDECGAYDADRREFLESAGWHVVRVANAEVSGDATRVAEGLLALARQRSARPLIPPPASWGRWHRARDDGGGRASARAPTTIASRWSPSPDGVGGGCKSPILPHVSLTITHISISPRSRSR